MEGDQQQNEFPVHTTSPLRSAFFATAIVMTFFVSYDWIASGISNDRDLISAEVSRREAEVTTNTFSAIPLIAESVYIYDETQGKVLFEKNAELQRPLASLAKIMTALTGARLAPDYATLTIEPSFITSEGDSGLRTGETWRITDLIQFMLVGSSNDGATAVASATGAFVGEETDTNDYESGLNVFVYEMNRTATELDLTQTYFLNPTGLDISEETSGAYGSARDITTLFRVALIEHPELFEPTQYEATTLWNQESEEHVTINTNDAIPEIPRLIASKTGYTDLAGGNLVVAIDAGLNHRIFISVLGSTERDRFDDVRALTHAVLTSTGAGESNR